MNRPIVLVVALCAAFCSTAAPSVAAEAWPTREDLVLTISNAKEFDRAILGMDTLRLTLAAAVFTEGETTALLAQDRDPYLALRQTISSDPKHLAGQIDGAPAGSIELSDDVIEVVKRIENLTQEKGIVPNSDLARVMFAGIRIFLLAAQAHGTDVHPWLCKTYPFNVACK